MNILLIGDYSMVHKNLKDGLEALGHTVVLLSDGDYWKNLPGRDMALTPEFINHGRNRLERAFENRVLKPLHFYRYYQQIFRSKEFDVVQAMSADLFFFMHRKRIYRYLLHKTKNNLFVLIPGNDCYTYEAWKQGKFKYFSFDDNPDCIHRFETGKYASMENDAYRYTVTRAKALIPVCPYEYEVPYQGFPNVRPFIQFPLKASDFKYSENLAVNGKIVIYHGISFYDNKGSKYITEAMAEIQKKYPDKVECVLTERIAYNEFLKKLQQCNIYVDACKTYIYGMAATIGMAMGKVILSGKAPEAVERIGRTDCPVINILPDKEQIV